MTEELKSQLDYFKDEPKYLRKVIDELEQENKELKEKITSLESEIRQKKMTIMMNNDHYLTVDENNRKYRSALEEIRENLVKLNTNDEDDFTYEFSKIEDKINEALDVKY